MSDRISRADAINAFWEDSDIRTAEVRATLKALPSAEAVQGEWGHMMIDGNKLMLALSEWWYSSFGLEETEESKAIHKVMHEVERYVDHEKSADYWIPCSERLPSEDGFYIATCDGEICGEDQPFTGFAEFENRKWVDDEDDYQCVLAWMPLPKPYREGGEQE